MMASSRVIPPKLRQDILKSSWSESDVCAVGLINPRHDNIFLKKYKWESITCISWAKTVACCITKTGRRAPMVRRWRPMTAWWWHRRFSVSWPLLANSVQPATTPVMLRWFVVLPWVLFFYFIIFFFQELFFTPSRDQHTRSGYLSTANFSDLNGFNFDCGRPTRHQQLWSLFAEGLWTIRRLCFEGFWSPLPVLWYFFT